MQEGRIEYFDIAKGWGILSVIVYHVAEIVGNRDIMSFINTYFLSLFFFISGYFAFGKSLSVLSFREYIIKQSKHLLVPFFAVGALFNLYIVFLTGKARLILWEDPKGGYWFLFVLFMFLISLKLIYNKLKENNIISYLWLTLPFFIVTVLGAALNNDIYYSLSLASFRRYYLIFATGVFLKMINYNFDNRRISIGATLLYILFSGYYTLLVKEVHTNAGFQIWCITNIFGCIFWLNICKKIYETNRGGFLFKIGQKSLGIYVLHFFFKSSYGFLYTVHPFHYMEPQFLEILVTSCIILIITYCVVVAFEKSKISSQLFLGK